jgi:hypothetical protein
MSKAEILARLVSTGSQLADGNISLAEVTAFGNTTSNTVLLTNTANSLVASGDIVAGNIILSGNITGTLNSSTSLPNSGVTAATYGNATIVPVITIDAKGRITSASNVTISGVGGGASSDSLANVTARGNVTSDPITLTNTGNSLVASGNIQTSGNIIATTGNVFARKFVSLANVSYFLEPAASNALTVAGNVYTAQRVGWTNVNNTVSVVYQVYNSTANSLDTIFG